MALDNNYQSGENEVQIKLPLTTPLNFLQDDDQNPPTISRSGQPINYALPADKPNIGHDAPTLTDVVTGRKHNVSYTKVTTRKKNKSPGQSSAVAALQTDALIDLPPSSSEGKILNPGNFI
jgi:hypothetical protein